MSGQDEANPVFLLATQVGKMDLGLPAFSSQENINFCFWPCNKCCISHALFGQDGWILTALLVDNGAYVLMSCSKGSYHLTKKPKWVV